MGFSFGHLLILGVILLLFGGRRIPELATALGKSARAFREALHGDGERLGQSGQAATLEDKTDEGKS